MTTTTLDHPMPRSYVPAEKKERLSQNLLYCRESVAAAMAGDEDAAWAWMSMATIPESATRAMTNLYGREFLESKGFTL